MIYIFKGARAVCDIPAACCSECGKAFNATCSGICKPIGKCINGTCDALAGICHRPLGCYVIMTIVMSMLTMYSSLLGVVHSGTDELAQPVTNVTAAAVAAAPTCDRGGSVVILLLLVCAIALVNIFCAFYVQYQTWQGLVDIVDEEEEEAKRTGSRPKKSNVAELILDSSGRVFCYDVCFCFNFFFLIVQYGIAYYGKGLVAEPNCNPREFPAKAMYYAEWYPFMCVGYGIGWFIVLHLHSCLESCCSPFGEINCCWGHRPSPRVDYDGGSSSDEEGGGWLGRPPPGQKRRSRTCCCCIPV